MTIEEIIVRADELKPNAYDEETKRAWIEELEARIVRDIIDTHEANESDEEGGLAGGGDGAVYLWWLIAQIDLNNGDMTRYNNDMALYNTYYADLAAMWNRTHTPNAAPKITY